jgi:hypothetical protein
MDKGIQFPDIYGKDCACISMLISSGSMVILILFFRLSIQIVHRKFGDKLAIYWIKKISAFECFRELMKSVEIVGSLSTANHHALKHHEASREFFFILVAQQPFHWCELRRLLISVDCDFSRRSVRIENC